MSWSPAALGSRGLALEPDKTYHYLAVTQQPRFASTTRTHSLLAYVRVCPPAAAPCFKAASPLALPRSRLIPCSAPTCCFPSLRLRLVTQRTSPCCSTGALSQLLRRRLAGAGIYTLPQRRLQGMSCCNIRIPIVRSVRPHPHRARAGAICRAQPRARRPSVPRSLSSCAWGHAQLVVHMPAAGSSPPAP